MSRFAILGDEVGEEKSKDKKTSNPKAAVKAAVAAPAAAAPVEAAAAQKQPKNKEVKKTDAPTGGGSQEEKDGGYKKENSKRENKKKDPEASYDRTKKDPKRKENKDKPGDPQGRPKIIAIIAEKDSAAVAGVAASSDAVSDAASENNNNNEDVEVIVVPAEPPKKTFADFEREREEARASLLKPKEGRKADTVKGTVVVNDETKDATARFYNAGASVKESSAKGEKKAKKVFEDVQFGTGDKGTPRPREFTPSTTPRSFGGGAGDRKGKPNANDFGPSLSASLGKK